MSGLSWKVESPKTTDLCTLQPTGKVSPTTAHCRGVRQASRWPGRGSPRRGPWPVGSPVPRCAPSPLSHLPGAPRKVPGPSPGRAATPRGGTSLGASRAVTPSGTRPHTGSVSVAGGVNGPTFVRVGPADALGGLIGMVGVGEVHVRVGLVHQLVQQFQCLHGAHLAQGAGPVLGALWRRQALGMVTPSPTCAATPKPLGTLPGAMWGVGAPQAGWCTRAGPAALECGVGGAAACLPLAAGGPQVGKDGPGRGGVAPSCGQSRRSGGCASASRCCRHGPAASPPAAQRQAPGGLRWGGGSPPGIPPSLGQQSSHWVPSASPSSGIRPPARPVGCSCIPRSVASYHPTFSTQPCAAGPPPCPAWCSGPPPAASGSLPVPVAARPAQTGSPCSFGTRTWPCRTWAPGKGQRPAARKVGLSQRGRILRLVWQPRDRE